MMKFLGLDKYFKKHKTKEIKELRDEMQTARSKIDALLNSIEGVYPSFENLKTAVDKKNKQDALYEVRNIGRWSPRISGKEKKEIESIQDLDEDIKIHFPELHAHILKSQNEVQVYINEAFIKNFPRYFGGFSKLLRKENVAWEQVSKDLEKIRQKIQGLVAALKFLKDNLDVQGARKKHYAEDMANVHKKLIFMYLRDNQDNIREALDKSLNELKSLLEAKGKNAPGLYYNLRLSTNGLLIELHLHEQIIFLYVIPYVRFEENQEGFYVKLEYGRSYDPSRRAYFSIKDKYYDDLSMFLEELVRAIEGYYEI